MCNVAKQCIRMLGLQRRCEVMVEWKEVSVSYLVRREVERKRLVRSLDAGGRDYRR